jgi:hypothetical protein
MRSAGVMLTSVQLQGDTLATATRERLEGCAPTWSTMNDQ